MTRDLLKKNFPPLAEEGALEICIIKVSVREPCSPPHTPSNCRSLPIVF